MSETTTIARPYANAAFEYAQKQSDLKGWSEFVQAAAEVVCVPDVTALITNPRVDKGQVGQLVVDALGGKTSQQQNNFIKILAENRRLQVLPEVAAIFEVLRAEAEKAMNVEVESAFELSAEQQQKIATSLKSRMNREIKLVCSVNKDLMGGVVIKAGDKVLDGSARARLQQLATTLAR